MTRIGSLLLAACAFAFVVQADTTKATVGHVGFRKFTLSYRDADGTTRTRPAMIWYPTSQEGKRFNYGGQIGLATLQADVAPGKHPLVLFSHGFLGFGDQTIFLTEALARRGYIVATLDHADSLRKRFGKPLEVPNFIDGKSWDDRKFRDRKDDMSALLDHLLEQHKTAKSFLHQRIDDRAIGGMGHSLGGYTMLGLAGARGSWRDERVRAVVALSPYTLPYLTKDHLSGVKVPVMLQGGTLDFGITPLLPKVYEKLGGPRYHLVLKNETHFGWTNLISLGKTTTECVKTGNAELMTEYSVAFFDRHLRHSTSDYLDRKNDRLHSYQHKAK